MILIDSNILVYAINRDSPKHKRAKAYLADHQKELALAQQNILETVWVLTHRKFTHPMTSRAALDAASRIATVATLITPVRATYYLACDLIKQHRLSGDRVFDAYLAATMLTNGVTSIATDNVGDYAGFRGIAVINPFSSS